MPSPELTALPWKSKKKPTTQVVRGLWFTVILFVLIAILIVDIAEDLATGTTFYHILLESLMILVAVVGAIYFWNRIRDALRVERDLERDLEEVRAENTRWHEEERDLLYNLQKAVNKQFTLWDFSSTEKEVAFYLLKGLSFKKIAQLRSTTDRTVKQQAYLLYHKAGLAGRAELSAFFLGGLLQPHAAPDDANDEPESQEGMGFNDSLSKTQN